MKLLLIICMIGLTTPAYSANHKTTKVKKSSPPITIIKSHPKKYHFFT